MVVQVARAVQQMLGDEEGEAEQMVAVLDARQATTLQVTRKVNLIKRLALSLNQVSLATQDRQTVDSCLQLLYISCCEPRPKAFETATKGVAAAAKGVAIAIGITVC